MAPFNNNYLHSRRGAIKIGQITFGILTISLSLLCVNWHEGRSCMSDGRVDYADVVNTIILVVNIMLFSLNLRSANFTRFERFYSGFGLILLTVAFYLVLWRAVSLPTGRVQLIVAATLIGAQMLLFVWDFKILHGHQHAQI